MMWQAVRRVFGFPGAAEEAVLAAARALHPVESLAWSTVVTDEPRRMVIAVSSGAGATLRRREFAVDKQSLAVTEIEIIEDAAASAPVI